MPILCWVSPTNGKNRYYTGLANDPNVPAGYVLTSGSDGATDERLQQYVAGVNNQGAGQVGGVYTDGDPGMRVVQPHYPNGLVVGPNYTFSSAHFYGYGIYGVGPYGWGQAYESNVVDT